MMGQQMKHLEHVVVAEGPVTHGAHKRLVTCVDLHMFLDIMFVRQHAAAFQALVAHLSCCLIHNRLHQPAAKARESTIYTEVMEGWREL